MYRSRMRKSRGWPHFSLLLLSMVLVLCTCVALELLLPIASGDKVVSKKKGAIDISHTDQGYFMAMHTGTEKRVKVLVSCGKLNQDFDLPANGEYVPFPLPYGNGTYKITINENTKGSSYTTVVSTKAEVTLADENLPFLHPSQYVNYSENTAAVALSQELCASLTDPKDKANAILKYVIQTISYDHMTAVAIQSKEITAYLPDLDKVLEYKLGICFDYAALSACMLRVQGIPTKLIIGKASIPGGTGPHAWIEVFIGGKWVQQDPTYKASGTVATEYVADPNRVY